MNINILDCTLRDGGYINDWKFSDNQIVNIISALKNANIDIIELGYLNDKKGQKSNSTLFDSVQTFTKLLNRLQIDKQAVVMINLGDFDIKKLPLQKDTLIDGIRLAFHKKDLQKAIKETKYIISLGYKVYFQPMVTKNYKDIEFLSLVDKANSLGVYSFYVVDSFGSMTLEEFQRYMILANNNLNENILLGYHSHNNMQLAFSNAINMCNTNLNRNIIVDASIYGVGRGAGNLNTELITDYLNNTFNSNYKTLPLLEIIDNFLSFLMSKNPWGFSPAQYLSASFDCHPNYATYLINKNTNNISSIKNLLEQIPLDKKLSFDQTYIKELYIKEILSKKLTTVGNLTFKDKSILLVASGKSVNTNEQLYIDKAEDNQYIKIALNHMPKFECDYYFFTNQKRYDEFKTKLNKTKLIITNNITTNNIPTYVLDFSKLVIINDDYIITSSAILFINYLILNKIETVDIIGLDGYKIGINNYSYDENAIINNEKLLKEENHKISIALNILLNKININILTPSIFKD